MGYEISEGRTLTFIAASAVNAHQPVAMVGAVTAASSLDETVVPAGLTDDVIGVARATQATAGLEVTVAVGDQVVKCIAAASLGAGAHVGIGTTTGRLIPVAFAGAASAGSTKLQVGRALVSARDGDIFAVLLDPRQIV